MKNKEVLYQATLKAYNGAGNLFFIGQCTNSVVGGITEINYKEEEEALIKHFEVSEHSFLEVQFNKL